MKVEHIRFKAKIIEENDFIASKGSWVIGDFSRRENKRYFISHPLAVNEDSEPIIYTVTEVDPETVCMFTGFCDKYVNLIWEGDILEHTQSHARFTVMFDRGAFFIRRNGTENADIYLFELFKKDNCLQLFKVVGNKFDADDGLESIYKPKNQ